nr:MAG TPA_asm: Spc19 [Caudoviricetes sp.]
MIISNHAVKDSYTLAVNSLISECKYTTALETLTNEIEPQFRAIRALITDIIARCPQRRHGLRRLERIPRRFRARFLHRPR